ncbi:MAG TPA: energy transducer TonB [Pyrinomonadaceae bacterium]|jgi:TonB family protein
MRNLTKNTSVTILTFFCLIFLFVGAANAQEGNSQNSTGKAQEKEQKQEKDSPLKIIRKPVVSRVECGQEYGLTRLRVTFDKSAKVTETAIVASSGCDKFDEEALKAASQIKFKPAIRDGEPVTTTKLVEYNFRKY